MAANSTVLAGPDYITPDFQFTVHKCPPTLRRQFRDVFSGPLSPIE